MKIYNKKKVYNVKININNKIDELTIYSDTLISELRQAILDKYLLSLFNYSLFYKNKKLTINDFHKVSYLFNDDLNPFLFIVNNKIISSDLHANSSIDFISNSNDKNINEMLSKFFEYKCLPFDANVKNNFKGKYKIKFSKPLLANEFIQFYNINNNKKYKYYNNKGTFNGKRLPIIKINKNKSISSDNIIERNKKENLMNKVILNNSKDMIITEKLVSSGINIFHQSLTNNKRKKNNYKEVSYLPFLNPEERYYREKLLDKKKWLDKKGFLVSVGNYKMGGDNHYISNYVSATPSEPPLCHNFRDVHKDKWVNKKGFY